MNTYNPRYMHLSQPNPGRAAAIAILAALAVNLGLLIFIDRLKTTDIQTTTKYHVRKINFAKPQPKLLKPPEPKKERPKKLRKTKPKVVKRKTVRKPLIISPMNINPLPMRLDIRLRALGNLNAIVPIAPSIGIADNDEPTVYELDTVDRPPEAVLRILPRYPVSAKKLGLEGWVAIEFIVDENGDVTSASVIDSSSRRFHQSALTAVRNWRFKPAIKNEQKVAVLCRQKLKFTLNN